MNIVMLCDLYADGLQYQENLLAKYYAKHGHQVTVIASTFDSALDYYAGRYDRTAPPRSYHDGPVRVIKLPYALNILNRLRRFDGVDAILERERPDLIFVHDIHLNLGDAARYRSRHPTCRIIMDYHADYSNSGKNWLSRRILHGVVRKAILYRHRQAIDRIFPVVPTSALFLQEIYGLPAAQLEILPLGADTDLAQTTMAEQAGLAVRASLGIPAEASVIFTGGKLTPSKKTHLLIEALRRLADQNLHLLVVGDAGPEHLGYRRRLESEAGGDCRVHFVGWVDGIDVYRFMDAADFAVFPSSQSVLWQQALGMGLPLIVGQVTGQDASYLNLHDNVVVLAEPNLGADSLAAEISRMTSEPGLLKRRQEGARKVARELLSYDVIVARTLGTT